MKDVNWDAVALISIVVAMVFGMYRITTETVRADTTFDVNACIESCSGVIESVKACQNAGGRR